MDEKKTVLSCIQPTGDVHIGNYFGAIQNWVALQDQYKCFYGVVDYHAMTMPYSPKKLKENTWDLLINLIAMGVKPEHLFIQSLIPEHAELSWIFNCFCSYGRLSQMTQFKDKSKDSSEKSEGFISAGLFDYPVLQAADILIYRADYVPVGKDQEQHLELSRSIATRFNQQMKNEYFVLPESLFTKTAKVMSTADPTRKMSKSAGEKHYISIFSDPARIQKQIRSAVTDTGDGSKTVMSPGVENLFSILTACNAMEQHQVLKEKFENETLQYAELKGETAEALLKVLTPIQERKKELLANKKEVKSQIKYSSSLIRKRAQETVREVKDICGLSNVKF